MAEQKLKILYVITQAEWGGAQRYVFDLATSQAVGNWTVFVAYGQKGVNDLEQKLSGSQAQIRPLKWLVRAISPINDIRAVFELKNIYQKIQPDIIHLNSSKASIVGSLAFYLIKINSKFKIQNSKLIYTAHGWVFNEPMSGWKKSLYKFLEKFTAKFKNKIICVSEFDRQEAIRNQICPAEKLTVIHNGIEPVIKFLSPEEARGNILPPPNLPLLKGEEKTVLVGTVANFYKTKGLEYLIEAFNILTTSYQLPATNYQLIIIGDGDERAKLENLIANYGLKNHLILVGQKENAARYLKAFDIYICSSVKEGLPYSILEAMAAARPIIATKVGGIPEIIQDQANGLLVEPKNSAQLAAAIKYLIENPAAADALAQQAVQDVAQNFSQSKMIEKTFSQYK